MPGGTEMNIENRQDSRCPGRDSKQAPPEYEPKALPLDQPARRIYPTRYQLTNMDRGKSANSAVPET
jgi:hypothetical protein